MPDQMTTTGSLFGGSRNDPKEEGNMGAVEEAVEALRQAMIDEGQDPATVDAKLHAAVPNVETKTGNLADLMRAGATATASGEGDVDYDAMTKPELQAELDDRGIDYPSSATKADLIELLGG